MAQRLREFIGWWLHELRETGEALLARISPRRVMRTGVILEKAGGSIWSIRGSSREQLATFTADVNGAWLEQLQPPESATLIRGTRTVFALAPEYVLSLELTLPDVVEGDLDAVLALQLERESPMPLSRVYTDRSISERLRQSGRIKVVVLIVQRDLIDRVRGLARAWGVHIVRAGMAGADGTVTGNFLQAPASLARLRLTGLQRRLAVSSAGLAMLCVCVIGAHWIRERIVLGRELARLHAPAIAAEGLAKQLRTTAEPAEALAQLMEQPDAVDVLTALTQDTPKDSWVYDLDISAQWPSTPRVRLTGFTPTATTLVGVLGSSGHFDSVRLVSALSAGLGSGQDQMQLTARWAGRSGQ